jgi:hypothetical protein
MGVTVDPPAADGSLIYTFRTIDQWGGIDDRPLHRNAVSIILRKRAEMIGITVGPSVRAS